MCDHTSRLGAFFFFFLPWAGNFGSNVGACVLSLLSALIAEDLARVSDWPLRIATETAPKGLYC